MGFFSKIFGNSMTDKTKVELNKHEENLEENKKEIVQPMNKNLFKGKNREEVKNHLLDLLNASVGSNKNIEKNIDIISNLNYNEQEKKGLIKLIKSNISYTSIDCINIIQSEILLLEKSIREGKLSAYESMTRTNNIKYLEILKLKKIVFGLKQNNYASLIIFSENGILKIVDIKSYRKEITEYGLFDLNFIFEFFTSQYTMQYFLNGSNQDALERYELLNSNLGKYINEYFNLIKISSNDCNPWEYGFMFENPNCSNEDFIDSIVRFVFISNLYDTIIPTVKSNNEKALAYFKTDSSNKLILVENGFDKLVRKNQTRISEIDIHYIHKFVKLSTYLNKKKENIDTFYKSIDKANFQEIQLRISCLKEQIQTYEMILFHSINMVGSLMVGDLVSFYEIYEVFDKLRVFNSNWENEIAGQLAQIGNSLLDLIDSIHEMENNIVGELKNLTYVIQESFSALNNSVSKQLQEVGSSINTNNLLSGIQAYQLYKINKNTKSLRS